MAKVKPDLKAALGTIPWFAELKDEHFDKLLSIASLRSVAANVRLFSEGDPQDFLYVLLKGRIAIDLHDLSRGRLRLATVEPIDVFGWSSVTPVVRQRTASATTVLPCELIALDADELRRLCDEDHDLGYVVMRRLMNVIAARLQVTRLQLLDMFSHPGEADQ
jgi:CRP-like cAMP-binding protein